VTLVAAQMRAYKVTSVMILNTSMVGETHEMITTTPQFVAIM